MGKLIGFSGLVQRNPSSGSLWVDVKSFGVLVDAKDNIQLCSFLSIHGEIKDSGVILSQSWHGKDSGGMTGNFLTTYSKAPSDPRPLPAIGTKTFCHGKIIGYVENNFCVEMISFDH